MRQKPRIMWAITNIDDRYFWHVTPQRQQSIKEFVGDGDGYHGYGWAYWKRRGYRAVKVTVSLA